MRSVRILWNHHSIVSPQKSLTVRQNLRLLIKSRSGCLRDVRLTTGTTGGAHDSQEDHCRCKQAKLHLYLTSVRVPSSDQRYVVRLVTMQPAVPYGPGLLV